MPDDAAYPESNVVREIIEGRVLDHATEEGRVAIGHDDGSQTWPEDLLKDFDGRYVRLTMIVEITGS